MIRIEYIHDQEIETNWFFFLLKFEARYAPSKYWQISKKILLYF